VRWSRHLPLEFLLEKRRQRWSAGRGPVSNGVASPASPLSPAHSRLVVRGKGPSASRTGAWLSKDSWRDWWRQKRHSGGGAEGASQASNQASGKAGYARSTSVGASQDLGEQGMPPVSRAGGGEGSGRGKRVHCNPEVRLRIEV
jgi:hypothetical protein